MRPTKILTTAVLIFVASSCNKVADVPRGSNKIEIAGTTIDTVKANWAVVKSSSINNEYGSISDHGFCWGTSPLPDLSGSNQSLGTLLKSGAFSSKLAGLQTATKYYTRSFAKNSYITIYGTQNEFTTLDFTLPEVNTIEITNITSNSVQSGGNVTNDGNGTVSARGVCWNSTGNPTLTDCINYTRDGTGTGSYTSQVNGLLQGIIYYLNAYATNEKGIVYGNELIFTTSPVIHYIGESFGGGIVFYMDGKGQHGLVAAISDQSTGAPWGCDEINITTGTGNGTGQINTTAIVNGCSIGGIAARICNDLVLNGYNDWFLPSKDELNELYKQKNVVGGFSSNYYWSSSEYSASFAWRQYFGSGEQKNYGKPNDLRVRAIRAF